MTHVADRTQQMQPVHAGASARVETLDEVRVTTPEKICGMGHRMKRKEDPRFIQGHGNYVDDVKLPGMLYLDIVRSPYAHAKILKIDASAALATPGVLAVITGQDLKAAGNLHWMPTLMSDTQMVLPIDKVVYYAQEVCAAIRAKLAELYSQELADRVRIQYGGSVKAGNVAEIMAQADIDGALVGGASLDADEFVKIVRFRDQ